MDCRDVTKTMDAYLDRELNPAAAEEMKAHLAACHECDRQWGGLVRLLADPAPVEVPEGLRDRIVTACMAELAMPGRSVSGRWQRPVQWLRYSGAIAACILFFFTGWLVSDWRAGSQRPEAMVADGAGAQPPVTVVVSPWIISSMAQAAAMPAPVGPAMMLARGVVPEMMVPAASQDEQRIHIYERPNDETTIQPADTGSGSGIPILPIVPRYPGA